MNTKSLWLETKAPEFPPLKGRVDVDVLVVGGGITGLTTAFLLKKEGRTVAVVDQQDIGGGETAHTTAHVTIVTDSRLHELASRHGKKSAQAFWDAGEAAIGQIQSLVHELNIDCDWKRVPGYLFAAVNRDSDSEIASLRKDADLASEFGFDAAFLQSTPLFERPAVRFSNQAKFHPLKYIHALASAIPGDGSHVFARTCGSNIDAEQRTLSTDEGAIGYKFLVAATHVPIQGERGTLGAALFQTKLAAYSSYAIEAKVESVPEALYWDTNDPYLYLRVDRREDGCFVIIGGEDHKTGQEEDTEACYTRLEQTLGKILPSAKPQHRWSGQVLETPDGLPYIGAVNDHQYLATGFSGNGMTLGTFSSMLIRDLILENPNPWEKLFDPSRKSLTGTFDYLCENTDFPKYFLKDHLAPAKLPEHQKRGTGEIVRIDGKKRAVYLDEHGKQSILSPVCPHMGCIVSWNPAEKTWDCPCHGSRFMATGELIAGPAESGLEKV